MWGCKCDVASSDIIMKGPPDIKPWELHPYIRLRNQLQQQVITLIIRLIFCLPRSCRVHRALHMYTFIQTELAPMPCISNRQQICNSFHIEGTTMPSSEIGRWIFRTWWSRIPEHVVWKGRVTPQQLQLFFFRVECLYLYFTMVNVHVYVSRRYTSSCNLYREPRVLAIDGIWDLRSEQRASLPRKLDRHTYHHPT